MVRHPAVALGHGDPRHARARTALLVRHPAVRERVGPGRAGVRAALRVQRGSDRLDSGRAAGRNRDRAVLVVRNPGARRALAAGSGRR